MSTVDELSQLKNELIRKPLRGFIAIADMTVAPPLSLTEVVGPSTVPTLVDLSAWSRLGNISKKSGIAFSRDTDAADVESWGAAEPTRTDLTKDITNAKWECQETRKSVLELYYNTDLRSITPDPVTGEIAFNQSTSLHTTYRRFLFVGVDGYGDNEIIIAKLMPRFNLNKIDDQPWNQDDAMIYGMAGAATVDSDHGFSVRHFFGGAGWRKLNAKMGFYGASVTVTITGSPTGGTFTLSVDGNATAGIAYNATAAAVKAALEALPVVGAGNASVSGGNGGPWVISVPTGTITGSATGLTGGTSPAVTVA